MEYRVIRVLEDSYAYHAAPMATPMAPILTPVARVLPKMATLNARLVNLRMLRIIVIVSAVDIADSRLTPRTHKYCVNTLRRRKKRCRGICNGKGMKWRMRRGI